MASGCGNWTQLNRRKRGVSEPCMTLKVIGSLDCLDFSNPSGISRDPLSDDTLTESGELVYCMTCLTAWGHEILHTLYSTLSVVLQGVVM